jgi:hypothetical protein
MLLLRVFVIVMAIVTVAWIVGRLLSLRRPGRRR